MAMSSAAVAAPAGTRPRRNLAIFDVTATADADAGDLVIAHGLGRIPEIIHIDNIDNVAGALSGWTINTALTTNVNVVVTKNGVGAGSGVAGAQLRVTVAVPQTTGR